MCHLGGGSAKAYCDPNKIMQLMAQTEPRVMLKLLIFVHDFGIDGSKSQKHFFDIFFSLL